MERIRFIDHQNQRILLVDLSNLSAADVATFADRVPAAVAHEPPGSVLLLADFTGSELTREAMERVKIAAVRDRKHLKRSAWVFNGKLPKPLHEAVQTFSGREIPQFETREAAVEFLTSDQSKKAYT